MTPFNVMRSTPEPADEPAPDSAPLRVSQQTALESGFPPARDVLGAREGAAEALGQLELVLVDATRAEANLGLLLRGLKHLGDGAGAAREANASMIQELELLRARVARLHEHETVLEKRVQMLENALDAAALEHRSWVAQEDAFLEELLDDQEQKLISLQRERELERVELERTIDELRLQRDQARTEATRLAYERDRAVAMLSDPTPDQAPRKTPPSRGATPSTPLGALKLGKPVLPSKPDPASRPLVGYSLSGEQVSEERIDPAQRSSRPSRT
jgi:hypothetical protein